MQDLKHTKDRIPYFRTDGPLTTHLSTNRAFKRTLNELFTLN